ncbi:MAG: transglycosylase domain-containing protein, partial [Alcanivoracaceae bacterium]|nr:transglycosylase domain-containing protein [Alcanivoracaceae bacterium]
MRWRKRLLWSSATLVVIALCSWALAPRPSLYGDTGFSSAVYASDGKLLRLTLAPDQRYRLFTPLQQLPSQAIDATLLYEDRWFFQHPGINPAAVVRAAWTTFVTRERTLGASTLSMQLARLRFAIDSSSIAGKLEQMLRALQLERHYSKQEILEAYLNLAPYGGNIEGLGTASQVYFGKPAAQLTLNEILSLVVVPQNPVQRAPDRGDQPSLRAARLRAFELWQAQHPDDATQRDSMQAPLAIQSRSQLPFLAPHFVDALLARYGAGSWHSSLDLPLQYTVEQQLASYLAE